MTSSLVCIKHLSKKFPAQENCALTNVTATIPPGMIVGLAGPDGAGKTTLLRLIAGLMLPSEGSISVQGFDTVVDASQIHTFTGYMPQKFGLYEDLTVQQNLTLYADLKGVGNEERVDVFRKLLAFTSLEPFVDRLAGKLSGGMKQKLGLACALLKKPTLLLLDEPSVGVDPISRRQLWNMVQELVADDISVVWSTAYLDEAEKCDTVILLNEGRCVFNGVPSDLTKRVEGRTFLLKNIVNNRRQVMSAAFESGKVKDGVIQGADIRLLLESTEKSLDVSTLNAGPNAHLVATEPRFEDAFIDILGGFSTGKSLLAEAFTKIVPGHENMIQMDHLTKKFGGFTAVDNFSLSIRPGEIFGLLGPNGAGKTTTFRMMCGLLKPTTGSAFVNGVDLLRSGSLARSQIGYMAQKFSLYGNLSTLQNLEFFAGIYGLFNKKKKEVIEQAIAIFSLAPYLDVNAELLPLGFKQRLALACSVMHKPSVLFLDEPTSGVDPLTRREFWMHINGLVEKGVTVMVTTHFMDEAEYCDRIALIYKGKEVVVGSPDELKRQIASDKNSMPTLEDAFIHFIESYDEAGNGL